MNKDPLFLENCQLLIDRCKESYFFLPQLFTGYSLLTTEEGDFNLKEKGGDLLFGEKNILRKMQQWSSSFSLDNIDLLYIYGIGLGYPYLVLKKWLEEKKERIVVFLEEDPCALGGFLHTPWAKEALSHERVHFSLFDPKKKEEHFQELADKFPLTKIDLIAIPPYENRSLSEMKLHLFRKTTLSEAILYDRLFSHRHFANFLPNLERIASSSLINRMKGSCQGIPAIICGAGPSLKEAFGFLKNNQNRALIIAGGSAIAALSSESIFPHIGMALDPNHEEYLRMKASVAFEMPLFYAMRLHHASFFTLNGPLGYMRSAIGGLEELWMDEELSLHKERFIGEKLNEESLSVTTIAISCARFLGCNPIILSGVDLAYSNQMRYVKGVGVDPRASLAEIEEKKHVSDRIFYERNGRKKKVATSTKWIMEADCIANYAKKFPKVRFFTTSKQGVPIQGIPYVSFARLQKKLQESFDLSSFLHVEMQRVRFPKNTEKKITAFRLHLQKSFQRCKELSLQILTEMQEMEKEEKSHRLSFETSRSILLEMDLKEEDGYLYFLSEIPLAIDMLLERKYPSPHLSRDSSFARTKEKWELFYQTVKEYETVFQKYLFSKQFLET